MVGDRKTLSILQACQHVGVSRRTIYNWINSGKVEYVRTAGGSVRIFADSLWRKPDSQADGLEGGVEDAGPRQSGQPQVGQDDVEGELAERSHRLFAVVGLDDVESGVGEQVGERETQGRLVLDEQEMRFLLRHLRRSTIFWRPRGRRVNAVAAGDRCR